VVLVWRNSRGGGSGTAGAADFIEVFFSPASVIALPFFAGRRVEVDIFFLALETALLGDGFLEVAVVTAFRFGIFAAVLGFAFLAERVLLWDFLGDAFFCANFLAINIP
jgi:hypothetical protein